MCYRQCGKKSENSVDLIDLIVWLADSRDKEITLLTEELQTLNDTLSVLKCQLSNSRSETERLRYQLLSDRLKRITKRSKDKNR